MNEQMKLIEGMKKLKLIEKRMAVNRAHILQYSSAPSNEKPNFGDEKTQMKEVNSLVQANEDLLKEYLHLKKRVDMTNLLTEVTIGKETFKLLDLLVLRRGLTNQILMTYQALSDKNAEERMKQNRYTPAAGEKAPFVVRFYDEKEKFENLQRWNSLADEIEQRLEVINATTEMVTI
jgi:hypothetical protein